MRAKERWVTVTSTRARYFCSANFCTRSRWMILPCLVIYLTTYHVFLCQISEKIFFNLNLRDDVLTLDFLFYFYRFIFLLYFYFFILNYIFFSQRYPSRIFYKFFSDMNYSGCRFTEDICLYGPTLKIK